MLKIQLFYTWLYKRKDILSLSNSKAESELFQGLDSLLFVRVFQRDEHDRHKCEFIKAIWLYTKAVLT
jgi:hypothetical protein